jgi:hypothetical protein
MSIIKKTLDSSLHRQLSTTEQIEQYIGHYYI